MWFLLSVFCLLVVFVDSAYCLLGFSAGLLFAVKCLFCLGLVFCIVDYVRVGLSYCAVCCYSAGLGFVGLIAVVLLSFHWFMVVLAFGGFCLVCVRVLHLLILLFWLRGCLVDGCLRSADLC